MSIQLADLLRETVNVDSDEVWENEFTPPPVRGFGMRLHSMGVVSSRGRRSVRITQY